MNSFAFDLKTKSQNNFITRDFFMDKKVLDAFKQTLIEDDYNQIVNCIKNIESNDLVKILNKLFNKLCVQKRKL